MKHPVRTYRILAAFLFFLAVLDVFVVVRYVDREQVFLAFFIGAAALIYAGCGVVALIYADRISGRKRD